MTDDDLGAAFAANGRPGPLRAEVEFLLKISARREEEYEGNDL